jgi:hypothetical protein
MKQPSPIENGFDPITKEWKIKEGKENYRKQVVEFAKYVSYNQKKSNNHSSPTLTTHHNSGLANEDSE